MKCEFVFESKCDFVEIEYKAILIDASESLNKSIL